MLRRLEKRILVDLPSREARQAMIHHWLPPVSKNRALELRTELEYRVLSQVSCLEGAPAGQAAATWIFWVGSSHELFWGIFLESLRKDLSCPSNAPRLREFFVPPTHSSREKQCHVVEIVEGFDSKPTVKSWSCPLLAVWPQGNHWLSKPLSSSAKRITDIPQRITSVMIQIFYKWKWGYTSATLTVTGVTASSEWTLEHILCSPEWWTAERCSLRFLKGRYDLTHKNTSAFQIWSSLNLGTRTPLGYHGWSVPSPASSSMMALGSCLLPSFSGYPNT